MKTMNSSENVRYLKNPKGKKTCKTSVGKTKLYYKTLKKKTSSCSWLGGLYIIKDVSSPQVDPQFAVLIKFPGRFFIEFNRLITDTYREDLWPKLVSRTSEEEQDGGSHFTDVRT